MFPSGMFPSGVTKTASGILRKSVLGMVTFVALLETETVCGIGRPAGVA